MANSEKLVGKMSTKKREFTNVVADVRRCTYAVTRHRIVPGSTPTTFQSWALGSGFLVSSKVFVTCCHVISPSQLPHQDGDRYDLISSRVAGQSLIIERVSNATVGGNVHLFPQDDLAILLLDGDQDRAYLPLDYSDVPVGAEIGVAGYPLPQITTVNMMLSYQGLIFRAAKSALSATYTMDINPTPGPPLTSVPILEVNFLFVPGNSGGPVFSAESGRALGFVHGFRTQKIQERVEAVQMPGLTIPQGTTYVAHYDALYSYGIRLERVRDHLESFNVSL